MAVTGCLSDVFFLYNALMKKSIATMQIKYELQNVRVFPPSTHVDRFVCAIGAHSQCVVALID